MANTDSRWIFTSELIENTQSRKDGIDKEQELELRQSTALFIYELGYKLKSVAASCLFFACKVEEHPTPLHRFIETIHTLLHPTKPALDSQSDEYKARWEEIIAHESCLLQTLGFNVLIHHAHTIIIKTCQMIKAPRDLAQTAYFMATNSLILTSFCVKFAADKVACFCIYLACKWTALKIPTSNEGREWFQYVNPNITVQQLEEISEEYLKIYDKCPAKIKKKLGFDQEASDEEKAKQMQQMRPSSSSNPPSMQHRPTSTTTSNNNNNNHNSSSKSLSNVNSTNQQQPLASKSSQQQQHQATQKMKQPTNSSQISSSASQLAQQRPATQQASNKLPPNQTQVQNRPPSSNNNVKSHENYHSTKTHYSNGNQSINVEEKVYSTYHNNGQQPSALNKTSMKRENDDLNGGSQAPSKMAKYLSNKEKTSSTSSSAIS